MPTSYTARCCGSTLSTGSLTTAAHAAIPHVQRGQRAFIYPAGSPNAAVLARGEDGRISVTYQHEVGPLPVGDPGWVIQLRTFLTNLNV